MTKAEPEDNTDGRESKRCTWLLRFLCGTAFLLFLGLVFYHSPLGLKVLPQMAIPESRYSLLFETDHEALLAACRQALSSDDPMLELTGSKSPQLLRDLDSEYIIVTDKKIRADLYNCTGKCAHFGFVAFAAEFEPQELSDLIDPAKYAFPPIPLDRAAIEIIPGLWYYDTRLDGRLFGIGSITKIFRRYYDREYR